MVRLPAQIPEVMGALRLASPLTFWQQELWSGGLQLLAPEIHPQLGWLGTLGTTLFHSERQGLLLQLMRIWAADLSTRMISTELCRLMRRRLERVTVRLRRAWGREGTLLCSVFRPAMRLRSEFLRLVLVPRTLLQFRRFCLLVLRGDIRMDTEPVPLLENLRHGPRAWDVMPSSLLRSCPLNSTRSSRLVTDHAFPFRQASVETLIGCYYGSFVSNGGLGFMCKLMNEANRKKNSWDCQITPEKRS